MASPTHKVVIVSGPGIGREASIPRNDSLGLTVGLDEQCGLSLSDVDASMLEHFHATFSISGNRVSVEPCTTSIEVFVNGAPIDDKRLLLDGDSVQLGRSGPILRVEAIPVAAQSNEKKAALPNLRKNTASTRGPTYVASPQHSPLHGLMKGLGTIAVLALLAGLGMGFIGYSAGKDQSKSYFAEQANKLQTKCYTENMAWAERVDAASQTDYSTDDTKNLQKVESQAREANVKVAADYAEARRRAHEESNRMQWFFTFGAKLAGGAFLGMIVAAILIQSTRPPKAGA